MPAEQRFLIENLISDAEEQLQQLRGAQYGKSVDAARQLLSNLGRAATLVDQALIETVWAAASAGVPLEEVSQWAGLPAEAVVEVLASGPQDDDG
ncbi:hypothetical protein [Streptomyces sp. TLI_146]|uniref:hypothetical protein n=1 Tax=Streptomyces sp. TLI_146 TaxID=1938858 RepID=UPI000C70E4AC|nr:hypothetical protein [Streptomyces sp. TLI_146]